MNALLKGLALMSAFATASTNKKDEKGAAFTEYVVLIGVVVVLFGGILAALNTGLTTEIGRIVGLIPSAGGTVPAT